MRSPSDMAEKSELEIDGVSVPVSNLQKVFYPKTGFTKGEVIDYYIKVSPVLLPHLRSADHLETVPKRS